MLHLEECAVSEPVIQRLRGMIEHRRMPQALVLEGDVEKTGELASVLAAGLVCQAEQNRPCGVCRACVQASAGSHPDIYTAVGGDMSRSFKVDAVRAVRGDAYIRSQEGGYKVYLLLRADSMSAQAQNALLKLLEEPPAQTVFLLTCQSASSLLPTVLSRAQVFLLTSVEQPLQQAEELAERMAQVLLETTELPLLQTTAPLLGDRMLLQATLVQLAVLFRDALAQRAGSHCLLTQAPAVRALCRTVPQANLHRLLQVVEQTRQATEFYANGTILVTALCAKLRAAVGR